MTAKNGISFLQDALKTAELEARAIEIEEALDVMCDHIAPTTSLNLTEIDVRYRQLKIELCDIYQTLFLRYRSLAK